MPEKYPDSCRRNPSSERPPKSFGSNYKPKKPPEKYYCSIKPTSLCNSTDLTLRLPSSSHISIPSNESRALDTLSEEDREILTFLEDLDALIQRDIKEQQKIDSNSSIPTSDSFAVSIGEAMNQVERIQIPRTPELDSLLTANAKFWNSANWLVRGRYFLRFDPNRLDIKQKRQKFIDVYHRKIQNQSKKHDPPYSFSSRASMEAEFQKIIGQSIKRANLSSGKQGYGTDAKHISYEELWSLIKSTRLNQSLPRKTAQQTLRTLISNWHGYFEAKREWRTDPSKFSGGKSPRPPGYQDKGGHYTATFTDQQCKIRNGFLYFPRIPDKKPILTTPEEQRVWNKAQTQGFISLTEDERYVYDLITYESRVYRTDSNGNFVHYFPPLKVSPRMAKIGTFKQVRIVLRGNRYICEIVYEKPINPDPNLDKTRILGIDTGQKNLITTITNIGLHPRIIRGSPVVSVNRFFKNRMAYLSAERDLATSEADKLYYTKRIERVTLRHYNKLRDYFHKASSYIVKYCQDKHIGTIIIGYNKGWKEGKKLSKRFRRDFYKIPFYTLLDMIEYKSRLVGIDFIETEESYTSKTCVFCGAGGKSSQGNRSRVHRGLYVCKHCTDPKAIHADVNGAINIVKKIVPHAFDEILANDPKKLLLAPKVKRLSSWYGQNGTRYRKMYTPAVC